MSALRGRASDRVVFSISLCSPHTCFTHIYRKVIKIEFNRIFILVNTAARLGRFQLIFQRRFRMKAKRLRQLEFRSLSNFIVTEKLQHFAGILIQNVTNY